jgi:3-isopropylmalate/(R)-2-methylmalate dehydratase small subunit
LQVRIANASLPKFSATVVAKYGDDVNTDYIIPAYLLQEAWGKRFFAEHAFERYDPSFVTACQRSNVESKVLVAGKNFGCGSSREQAVYAIQYNNVRAVIAESFPDIFYRNSLNNGFPALAVSSTKGFSTGDELEIDLENLTIVRKRNNEGPEEAKISMSREDMEILRSGSRLDYVRDRLQKRLLHRN